MIKALDGPARHRHPHRRHLRRPRRGPLARRRRRLPEARLRRRSRRVRAPHQPRSRHLHPADLGRDAAPADAGQALGAADRHPPVGAIRASCGSARAPIPISAPSRCSTCSTSRIADWDLVLKWLFDKIVGAAPAADPVAALDRHRSRREARLARSDPVPPEALRLQQRADRGVQVPLDVCRPGR